jgi:glycosyltransferase involved in cell wall biosynthesis
MNPLVSVVMAAKNYAQYLPLAIQSVVAQTYSHWELLIIDDGSTDETPHVVQPVLNQPRVRYIRSDRLGQSRAKNLGIGLSRGEYIAFLDADDIWEPTKLSKQLAVFREQPEVGLVFTRRLLIDESGKPLGGSSPPTPPHGQVLSELFVQNFVCFSSVVVRREVFAHVGRFDPQLDLAIDYDLWLRVAGHYRFACVDEALVRYRTGHGNLSRNQRDRVETALAIMHRAQARPSVAAAVPASRIATAYASTYRTLAYVLRSAEPFVAVQWYLRALRWPQGRVASLKGLAAALLCLLSGRRTASHPANASVNR